MSETNATLKLSLQQTSPITLNVNLQCHSGELLALVGPSGSGKSTVLRSIAGLQSVANAQVSCGGNIWLDTSRKINVKPQARSVGLVFQHYALFPHMSVLENVLLAIPDRAKDNGKLRKTQRKAIAARWLNLTNMTGLENRKPSALSGGQRQRVALARALARQPQVLLLDEPFSAVDQQTRRKLYRELAQLRANLDIPMILVTHDITEVQQLADSLCLIHKGQTLQQGDVQHVINAPGNKSIARLLGHQNLFDATVADHSNKYTRYKLSPDEYLLGPLVDVAVGTDVNLLIAPSAISLDAPRDRATDNDSASALGIGTGRNRQLQGKISDAVGLGDELSLRMHLDNIPKSLRFRISQHEAKSREISTGATLRVYIRPSGIHAMAV